MIESILSKFSPYRLMIEIAVIGGLLISASIWWHRFLDSEQEIGYKRAVAEYDAKLVIIQAEAVKESNTLRQQVVDAQNAGVKREQENALLLTAVNSTSIGLRNATNSIIRGLPTDTIDALRATTIALTTVFNDCQSKYVEMAKNADGHANDTKTLVQAWPVIK